MSEPLNRSNNMATETTTAIVMLLDDAPVYADGARIL